MLVQWVCLTLTCPAASAPAPAASAAPLLAKLLGPFFCFLIYFNLLIEICITFEREMRLGCYNRDI